VKDLEALRRRYEPEQIRVLWLGESPPRGGRRFFYLANSTWYRCAQPVFSAICGYPQQPGAFLDAFRDSGFYLADFFAEPGAKPTSQSPTLLAEAVSRVAAVIAEHRPQVVIALLIGLRDLVRSAVEESGLAPEVRVLRFPRFDDPRAQADFQQQLRMLLDEFDCFRD
jgi:hypothetical protein